MGLKIILTGASGFVGEGVLLECLADPQVEQVLSVVRRPVGPAHTKLKELVVKDFRDLDSVKDELRGYDACFYCAGVSSAGMSEADYTVVTYDTPLAVGRAVLAANPSLILCHVSGQATDSSGEGRVMWARVKGRAENALSAMSFQKVYHFRPGLMQPTAGQKHVTRLFKVLGALAPPLGLVFPNNVGTVREVGRAMINAVRLGSERAVLEVPDIRALAAR